MSPFPMTGKWAVMIAALGWLLICSGWYVAGLFRPSLVIPTSVLATTYATALSLIWVLVVSFVQRSRQPGDPH